MVERAENFESSWTGIKRLAGHICAGAFKLRYFRKIRGSVFLIRKPSLVRIESPGRIILGSQVHIEPQARIVVRDALEIGEDVYIGKNCTMIAFSGLSIGARTLIGENVSIHTENHGPPGMRDQYSSAAVSIGEDVWIGAGVVVTAGVSIGNRVTVGANAVVTKSMPDGVIVAGVPAKVIGQN
jgi:maltose O-acetyltransferase